MLKSVLCINTMPPKKQTQDKILDKCTRVKYLQIANDITHTEDTFIRLLNNKNFTDDYDNSYNYYIKPVKAVSYAQYTSASNGPNVSTFYTNLTNYIKNNINTLSRELVLLLLNNEITKRHYNTVSNIGDILIPLLSKVSFNIDIIFLNDVVLNISMNNLVNILDTYKLQPTSETLMLILKNNYDIAKDYYGTGKRTNFNKLINNYNIPITYDHFIISCELDPYIYDIIKQKLNIKPDIKCLEAACLYKNKSVITDILSYGVIPTKECLYNYTLYNNDISKYNNNYDRVIFDKLISNVKITNDCVINVLDNDVNNCYLDKVMDYADNSYEILLKLCKSNNTNKYILKLIENGVIPDNECLKEICKTKQNVKALTKILEYVEPTKEDIITAYRKK